MSKVRNLLHIVFSTRNRHPGIPDEHKNELYGYILTVCRSHECFLLRIGGINNHIHLLIDLHPSVSLSSFMRKLKQGTSIWMKNNDNFANFNGWNEGYYAFSISEAHVSACVEYINSQYEHHKSVSLIDETQRLAARNHVEWHSLDW